MIRYSCEKMSFHSYPMPYTKINLTWIIDTKVKLNQKDFKKKTKEKSVPGVSENFFNTYQKAKPL